MEEKDQKELDDFRMKDIFDLRYVKKEGTYQLILTLVFGFVGLIVSSFVVGLLAVVFHVNILL
jgi:uncharacterized membrane protein